MFMSDHSLSTACSCWASRRSPYVVAWRQAAGFVVVPAGAENQPVVLDEPEVLVLKLTCGGIHILVGHLLALLGGRHCL